MPTIPGLSRARKIAPPDPSKVYRCLMSYWSPEGNYQRGARLRGDHPAPSGRPLFWAPEGLDDAEEAALFKDRFGPTANRY